jgi:hypothetical protein
MPRYFFCLQFEGDRMVNDGVWSGPSKFSEPQNSLPGIAIDLEIGISWSVRHPVSEYRIRRSSFERNCPI